MNDLLVKLHTVDENVMFKATARENPEIVIDHFTPIGTGNGYASMELLMASFGSCMGNDKRQCNC